MLKGMAGRTVKLPARALLTLEVSVEQPKKEKSVFAHRVRACPLPVGWRRALWQFVQQQCLLMEEACAGAVFWLLADSRGVAMWLHGLGRPTWLVSSSSWSNVTLPELPRAVRLEVGWWERLPLCLQQPGVGDASGSNCSCVQIRQLSKALTQFCLLLLLLRDL